MQTAINPGLAQVLGAMDVINPVTPDGKNVTVAAKVMQAAQQAMTPQVAMPQVAQQAGLAGQIQAMQMQEAQKAMMQAAMQGQPQMQQQMQQMQQQMPQGIERLNPQMGNFAEGGIVGYAEAGVAEDEQRRLAQIRREYEQEVGRFTDDVPYVPGGTTKKVPTEETSEAAGIETLLPEAEAIYAPAAQELEKLRTTPPTGQEVIQYLQEMDPAQRAYYISKGIDPDALMKREAENKRLFDAQRALLQERMARQEGGDTMMSRLGAALRGFRQMKGQGIGGGILSSYENLARQVESGQLRMDQLKDAELKINELEVGSRRSLEDARRSIAEGDWKKAQSELAASQKMANDATKLRADLKSKIGAAAVQMRGQDVRAETAMYAADVRRELGLARAGGDGREPIVRRVEEDAQGNKIAIMSFGPPKPLGFKSAEFELRIGRMQQQLLKDGPPGYRKLPFEEQRQIAMEYVVGKPAAAGNETPPPSAAPGASATLPPSALAQLKENEVTKFANGQEWTLQNGQPKRVK